MTHTTTGALDSAQLALYLNFLKPSEDGVVGSMGTSIPEFAHLEVLEESSVDKHEPMDDITSVQDDRSQQTDVRAVCDLVLSRADTVAVQILRNKLMLTGEGRYELHYAPPTIAFYSDAYPLAY
jgi:hypothetical protein